MIGNLGMSELVIILFIVLLIFGGRRIPEIARSIGGGIKEFRKGMKDEEPKSLPESKNAGTPPPAGESKS